MGNFKSRGTNLEDREFEALQEETGFKRNELRRLERRFNHIDHDGNGVLTAFEMLTHFPALRANPLGT